MRSSADRLSPGEQRGFPGLFRLPLLDLRLELVEPSAEFLQGSFRLRSGFVTAPVTSVAVRVAAVPSHHEDHHQRAGKDEKEKEKTAGVHDRLLSLGDVSVRHNPVSEPRLKIM